MFEQSEYKSLAEWRTAEPSGYFAAFKLNLIDELCEKYGWTKRHHNFWTIKENVLADAKKYKTKTAWAKGPSPSPSAYASALNNGWLDECTQHMEIVGRPVGPWTKIECLEKSSKYKTIAEWRNKHKMSYDSAILNGWFEECSNHMSYGCKPQGYWLIKENVLADAANYSSRTEWSKNSNAAYNVACKNSWLDECCIHMISGNKPIGYWTKERVLNEAKKYKTRTEWHNHSSGSLDAANRNGWLNECTAHMIQKKRPIGYWTKERVLNEAKKYKTISEWQRGNSTSYKVARKNGWLNECTKHIMPTRKPSGYWTKECILNEAKKHNTRTEWKTKCPDSYNAACRKGFLEICTAHMVARKKLWTLYLCIEDALNYDRRWEWDKNSSTAYNTARKNGWLDECTKHMIKRGQKNNLDKVAF